MTPHAHPVFPEAIPDRPTRILYAIAAAAALGNPAPSFRELARIAGGVSLSTVKRDVDWLADRGLVGYLPGAARTVHPCVEIVAASHPDTAQETVR